MKERKLRNAVKERFLNRLCGLESDSVLHRTARAVVTFASKCIVLAYMI